jgi:hypothetical protein
MRETFILGELKCRWCKKIYMLKNGKRRKRGLNYCSDNCRLQSEIDQMTRWIKEHPEERRDIALESYHRNKYKRDNRKRRHRRTRLA